jgi:amidohydrolase
LTQITAAIIQARKNLHQLAETAFNETRTSSYVAGFLRDLDLPVRTGVAGTGVVAVVEGDSAGPTVALRSDMDALPVAEATGVEWASLTPGVMHACGHDTHMAMLLGAAMLLSEEARAGRLHGRVKLIFQPAEEYPGGADPMIREGVMDCPKVDRVIGMHVNPDLPVGQVGIKRGPVTAAMDQFTVVLTGRGGHAATPHNAVDALVAACEFVNGLQQIVSRKIDPLEPAIVSVGRLVSGTAFNIVAETAEIVGTVRTVTESTRDRIEAQIRARALALAQATGVAAEVTYSRGYPPVVNHEDMVLIARRACSRVVGAGDVVEVSSPSMVGEDFAYFARLVPGILIWLGAAPLSGERVPLHHPKFLVPEEVLETGARVLAEVALEALQY